jgi:hypothetical protein
MQVPRGPTIGDTASRPDAGRTVNARGRRSRSRDQRPFGACCHRLHDRALARPLLGDARAVQVEQSIGARVCHTSTWALPGPLD